MKKIKNKKLFKISQKKIFLKSEGNAYFLRNKNKKRDHKTDILTKIIEKKLSISQKKNILEIGCSYAGRLDYLKKKFTNNNFFGIDPSSVAIKFGKKLNPKLKLSVGEASKLKFSENKFDIVIFGFCLYLCDDDDLFNISQECYRVLKKKGFIIIKDFITRKPIYNNYGHALNIKSRKMNYINMFDWHPKIKLETKMKYLMPKYKRLNENFVTVAVLKKIE